MIDFYLVTGFLGAGKTTFLKNFLRLLAPRRIHLIINEFGKQGVDGTLLREVGAVLDEINNGSIFCACRLDKFEQTLHTAQDSKPEVIVAEASGLSDPTNVRKVLRKFSNINYKGSICLVDAVRLERVYDTAQVCKRQLAVSSLALLNKTDVATKEQCEKSIELIELANPAAHIEYTQFGAVDEKWLSYITPGVDIEEAAMKKDITLQKISLNASENVALDTLKSALNMLADSTYRMKGLVKTQSGDFVVDCTGPDIVLRPWSGEVNNKIVLLAGKGMPLRKAVKDVCAWYADDFHVGD